MTAATIETKTRVGEKNDAEAEKDNGCDERDGDTRWGKVVLEKRKRFQVGKRAPATLAPNACYSFGHFVSMRTPDWNATGVKKEVKSADGLLFVRFAYHRDAFYLLSSTFSLARSPNVAGQKNLDRRGQWNCENRTEQSSN